MSELKHTQGPEWKVKVLPSGERVVESGFQQIAAVPHPDRIEPNEEWDANAHFISASPNMFAALQRAQAALLDVSRFRSIAESMRGNAAILRKGEGFADPELQPERDSNAESMEFWATRIEEELAKNSEKTGAALAACEAAIAKATQGRQKDVADDDDDRPQLENQARDDATMRSWYVKNEVAGKGYEGRIPGFCKEGTGGGCDALIQRLPNGFAIYLTDGDLNVPERGEDPCEMVIFTDEESQEYIEAPMAFENANAAYCFFASRAAQDAIYMLGTLSELEVEEISSPSLGAHRGFASLDPKGASQLLLNVPSASQRPGDEEWHQANEIRAIEAFDFFVIGNKQKLPQSLSSCKV